MSRVADSRTQAHRSPLVERVEAELSVEDRLDACLEPPDRKRLEVAVRRFLATVTYYGPASALVAYVTVNVWAVGSLVAVLLAAVLSVSTVQSLITLVLSLVKIPIRPLTARGRRGYGWFVLTTAVETAEAAFGTGCLYLIGHYAEWWGLLP